MYHPKDSWAAYGRLKVVFSYRKKGELLDNVSRVASFRLVFFMPTMKMIIPINPIYFKWRLVIVLPKGKQCRLVSKILKNTR